MRNELSLSSFSLYCRHMFVQSACFFSDTADNSATADTEREVLAVGPNDGQLREEVSGRF